MVSNLIFYLNKTVKRLITLYFTYLFGENQVQHSFFNIKFLFVLTVAASLVNINTKALERSDVFYLFIVEVRRSYNCFEENI